jgi:hypothetical protein
MLALDSDTHRELKDIFKHNAKSFTRASCGYVALAAGIKFAETNVDNSMQGNIRAFHVDASDAQLYNKWLALCQRETVDVVMDGLFINHNARDFKSTATAMIQCAYFQLLLNGGQRLSSADGKYSFGHTRDYRGTRMRTIRIVDGWLQKVDGMNLDRFYVKYILWLARTMNVNAKACFPVLNANLQPVWFSKYVTPVVVTDASVKLGGFEFPITEGKRGEFVEFKMTERATTAAQKIRVLRDELCTPFPKRILHKLLDFDENDPIFAAIENLNFFRDAYKCDIALQLNGVLVCSDRIMALYYKMLCEFSGNPCELLCVFASDDGARLIT